MEAATAKPVKQEPPPSDDLAPAAGAAPLVGRRVRVEGLAGRPELNGRCGEATAYDAARERYCVAVEGEPSPLLLRADNLNAIGPAAAAADDARPEPQKEVRARV